MSTDGSVLPPNLVKDRFVHFSADNIDINDRILDGENTFHATQVAAWQRGPPSKGILNCIKLSTRETECTRRHEQYFSCQHTPE